jgi:hypothetical protein
MSTPVHGYKSRRLLASAAGLALVCAGAALAADAPKPRAAALQALVECRKVADPAQRLTCYDAAAGGLEAAEAAGDVVIVDRAQVQEAQRAAFGFNFRMPAFLTGGGGDDAEAEKRGVVLDTLETTAVEARQVNGKWYIVLADGAIWRQTDNEVINSPPKAGSKITIKRAALGSYFLSVGGQRSVRAKRDN